MRATPRGKKEGVKPLSVYALTRINSREKPVCQYEVSRNITAGDIPGRGERVSWIKMVVPTGLEPVFPA